MAFKNLENRFNENVNKLYAGATLKFENGKSSTGRNDDPLIVRKPGNGYWNFAESRGLPVVSALLDVKRLTLFTLSKRGLLFLAKQQLLQTGNTFEQTRLINPLFTVGNAVPFLHLRRHLRPVTGGPGGSLLGKTDRNYSNVRKLGQLQKSTYDSFTENAGGGAKAFLKKLAGPITSTISAFTAKKNVGEEFGYEEEGWKKTRPELGKTDSDYVASVNAPKFKFGGNLKVLTFSGQSYGAIPKSPGAWNGKYTTYIKFTDAEFKWALGSTRSDDYINSIKPLQIGAQPIVKNTVSDTAIKRSLSTELKNSYIPKTLETIRDNYQQDKQNWYEEITGGQGIMPYLKYFTGDLDSITDGRQYDPKSDTGTNAKELATGPTGKRRKISYIKDDANLPTITPNNQISKKAYQSINNQFEDPIVVSFAMGTDGPIRFRAYIKDLQQSATPEYKSYQYIGRMEKFVNYVGVQREISFKLGVIAFSRDELDGVWKRINYLTGLVFPYGFNRGIFQPNIVRLTIGDVYTEQPGYVTSLSTNFNDLGTSWELDTGKQVPIGAEMDIKFVLIEKSSKVADSPFYGITEEMEGFSKSLPTAGPDKTVVAAPVPSANPPSVKQEYDVVERNLINAYNVAVERGATQREINAIMQRLGEYRDNRLFPNRPRP